MSPSTSGNCTIAPLGGQKSKDKNQLAGWGRPNLLHMPKEEAKPKVMPVPATSNHPKATTINSSAAGLADAKGKGKEQAKQ
jgi:hypothetical protein